MTADIVTIMGSSMPVVLLKNEFHNSVKLIGKDLITGKNGDHVADKIFHTLKSKDSHKMTYNQIQGRDGRGWVIL